jgi:hypothetical protein
MPSATKACLTESSVCAMGRTVRCQRSAWVDEKPRFSIMHSRVWWKKKRSSADPEISKWICAVVSGDKALFFNFVCEIVVLDT